MTQVKLTNCHIHTAHCLADTTSNKSFIWSRGALILQDSESLLKSDYIKTGINSAQAKVYIYLAYYFP